MFKDLLKKYNKPVPRYTSYPTVPFWQNDLSTNDWSYQVKLAFAEFPSWSLYIHLPFCESLCSYCGCNTVITRNHKKEKDYIAALKSEFDLYLKSAPGLVNSPLVNIHLGGGSPNFFSVESMNELISHIKSFVTLDKKFIGSVEVDPRKVTFAQLKGLYDLGFKRVSFGVQDLNLEVQKLLNRIQSFEQTKTTCDWARNIGFDSINIDLIYGLPKQNRVRMINTIEKTLELKPDRIALYSLALVPWIKPSQRLFKDSDLPFPDEKRMLYELARELLLENGYIEIGMDHFALPTDELAEAYREKNLHRNFMGYTEVKNDILLGLGVSSISEVPGAFHQNEKDLNQYYESLEFERLPTLKGHLKSKEDKCQQEKILQLMTQYRVTLSKGEQLEAMQVLKEFFADGLCFIEAGELKVSPEGVPFLRNICTFFDKKLRQANPEEPLFSSAI